MARGAYQRSAVAISMDSSLQMTRADTDATAAHSMTKRTAANWDAAYSTYAPALLRYLRRLSRDATSAEELMQETFVRAIQSARVPAEGELRPWLYRIASNLVIDRARRARLLRFVPFAGTEEAPTVERDAIEPVREALRAIAPELAVTLVLRLHEGFSRSEIARLTGVSERTVKLRLERGRAAFTAAYERIERGR